MINRKTAKGGQVTITFTIPADQAADGVSVVGDFNDWDPYAHPMMPQDGGTYEASVTVPAEQSLCFRYLADGGRWFDDEDADHHDEHGGHLHPTTAPPSRSASMS
jgi:1,4-alpha-glucan branching enzyme